MLPKRTFPTVRAAVCSTDEAREFLQALGLTEPDPVDDVIQHVLPKYREGDTSISDADYEADIERIVGAFATDSTEQKTKLAGELRQTAFLMVVESGSSRKCNAKPNPDNVYLATGPLKDSFSEVEGIYFVDNTYECLCSEKVRELLEALGLNPPHPVDDVIWHVLPKYREAQISINPTDYGADINRILEAFATDSRAQREKLISELQETSFVMSVDAEMTLAGGSATRWGIPGDKAVEGIVRWSKGRLLCK